MRPSTKPPSEWSVCCTIGSFARSKRTSGELAARKIDMRNSSGASSIRRATLAERPAASNPSAARTARLRSSAKSHKLISWAPVNAATTNKAS